MQPLLYFLVTWLSYANCFINLFLWLIEFFGFLQNMSIGPFFSDILFVCSSDGTDRVFKLIFTFIISNGRKIKISICHSSTSAYVLFICYISPKLFTYILWALQASNNIALLPHQVLWLSLFSLCGFSTVITSSCVCIPFIKLMTVFPTGSILEVALESCVDASAIVE